MASLLYELVEQTPSHNTYPYRSYTNEWLFLHVSLDIGLLKVNLSKLPGCYE